MHAPALGSTMRQPIFAPSWVPVLPDVTRPPTPTGSHSVPMPTTVFPMGSRTVPLRNVGTATSGVLTGLSSQKSIAVRNEQHPSLVDIALETFAKCDRSCSGYLAWNTGEIRTFVSQSFLSQGMQPPPEEQLYRAYATSDTNKDGMLDRDECVQIVEKLSAMFRTAASNGMSSLPERTQALHESNQAMQLGTQTVRISPLLLDGGSQTLHLGAASRSSSPLNSGMPSLPEGTHALDGGHQATQLGIQTIRISPRLLDGGSHTFPLSTASRSHTALNTCSTVAGSIIQTQNTSCSVDDWVADYKAPPLISSSINYLGRRPMNFDEVSRVLVQAASVNEEHYDRMIRVVESGHLMTGAYQIFKSMDKDRNGVLQWNNGEIRSFINSVMRAHGLTQLSETQTYDLYTMFDVDCDAQLDARECMCLVDAIARGMFYDRCVRATERPNVPALSTISALPMAGPPPEPSKLSAKEQCYRVWDVVLDRRSRKNLMVWIAAWRLAVSTEDRRRHEGIHWWQQTVCKYRLRQQHSSSLYVVMAAWRHAAWERRERTQSWSREALLASVRDRVSKLAKYFTSKGGSALLWTSFAVWKCRAASTLIRQEQVGNCLRRAGLCGGAHIWLLQWRLLAQASNLNRRLHQCAHVDQIQSVPFDVSSYVVSRMELLGSGSLRHLTFHAWRLRSQELGRLRAKRQSLSIIIQGLLEGTLRALPLHCIFSAWRELGESRRRDKWRDYVQRQGLFRLEWTIRLRLLYTCFGIWRGLRTSSHHVREMAVVQERWHRSRRSSRTLEFMKLLNISFAAKSSTLIPIYFGKWRCVSSDARQRRTQVRAALRFRSGNAEKYAFSIWLSQVHEELRRREKLRHAENLITCWVLEGCNRKVFCHWSSFATEMSKRREKCRAMRTKVMAELKAVSKTVFDLWAHAAREHRRQRKHHHLLYTKLCTLDCAQRRVVFSSWLWHSQSSKDHRQRRIEDHRQRRIAMRTLIIDTLRTTQRHFLRDWAQLTRHSKRSRAIREAARTTMARNIVTGVHGSYHIWLLSWRRAVYKETQRRRKRIAAELSLWRMIFSNWMRWCHQARRHIWRQKSKMLKISNMLVSNKRQCFFYWKQHIVHSRKLKDQICLQFRRLADGMKIEGSKATTQLCLLSWRSWMRMQASARIVVFSMFCLWKQHRFEERAHGHVKRLEAFIVNLCTETNDLKRRLDEKFDEVKAMTEKLEGEIRTKYELATQLKQSQDLCSKMMSDSRSVISPVSSHFNKSRRSSPQPKEHYYIASPPSYQASLSLSPGS